MKPPTFVAAAMLSTLVFSAPNAIADEPAPSSAFRARGSMLVSSTGGGSIASSLAGGGLPWVGGTPFLSISHDGNDGSTPNSTAIIVNPALDVFVVDGLSLGGEVAFARGSSDLALNDVTIVAFSPRVGWSLPLGGAWSLWARAGGAIAYESTSSVTRTIVAASLDAQLLWHPAKSFFVGVGPGVTHDFFVPISVTEANGQSVSGEGEHHTRIRVLAFTIGGVL